ncbi:MAG: hypothetical protein BGO69_11850 [Bacteroidetes bacterium 46-16]|mgnify:CR=1 FL=1|jgi:transcriptional regulator with XRE-family HTH domain|nr:MAG: hypothetical protein BGO69_11850 [Bacteroidetes bacterium 46-16]
MPEIATPHIGKKIERIRSLRGIKQETLAAALNMSQGAVSKLEQSETIEDEKLKLIAEALGVSVDAIKNFDENAILGTSNFFNSHFQDNAAAVINQFNPIEKIVELYERLLESERQKNELLEAQLQKHTP